MSTEIQASLSTIKHGVDGMIRKQLDTELRLDSLENKSWQRKTAGVGGSTSSDDASSNILKMALANVFQKEGRSDAFAMAGLSTAEGTLIQESTKKAMDSGTGGAGGGFVIPQQWWAQFIEALRARLTVVAAGATVMENLSGIPVSIPKQLSSSSVAWIGQNQNITLSDATLGQVMLTPKTMAIRTQFSNLLGMLSAPGTEQIVRRDFQKVAALELDRVALRGLGVSGQPLGLNGIAGIGSYAIGTNGGDLTRQDLLKMVGVLEDQNALDGKLAFITSPKAKRVLKNERIAQFSGQTLGAYQTYALGDAALKDALGYDIFATTQIPVNLVKGTSTDCTEVYFGNFEELLIGQWGAVEILATNIGGNAWAQNAIEVRLVMNVDIQVRHALSFVYCADARIVNA